MPYNILVGRAFRHDLEIWIFPRILKMRMKTTILFSILDNNQRAIHFTQQPLAGSNQNIWFPIGDQDIFEAVENIMVMNHQAVNVTSVDLVRSYSNLSADYSVSYNISSGVDWSYIDKLLEANRANELIKALDD